MVSSRSNDRGATIVVIATTILLLFGFAALAIDAGMGYNDRRGTTNAADNAALAAAWEECNPTGIGSQAAAVSTAAANGYNNADSETTVEAVPLGNYQWQVTISKINEGIFSRATPYASDTLKVVSEAVAMCDPFTFLDGMAIFAGAHNCGPDEINMTGASITVDGGIHSNGDLKIHATPETEHLSGPITWRHSGSHGSQLSGPPTEYPIDISISEYAPGGTRALAADAKDEYFSSDTRIDNTWLSHPARGHLDPATGQIIHSGIYYTSFTHSGQAAIDLHGVSTAPGVNVTFVTPGLIEITGSSSAFRGYDEIVPGGSVPMLLFSNRPGSNSCNTTAIKVSSANIDDARGVVFAPRGVIEFSNATMDLDGSIIGWRIDAHGSELGVHYENDPAFEIEYAVELIR